MKSLLILLIIITLGCSTTTGLVEPNYILPAKPTRTKLEPAPVGKIDPELHRWVADTLIYYEGLIQKWELWGYTVEIIVSPEG